MSLTLHTEAEFKMLFTTHYDALCRTAWLLLKDRDMAEDVVQDVFVKLWLRRHELEIRTSFKAYLYKAVTLRAIDYLRREKRVEKISSDSGLNILPSDNSASSFLENKEINAAIEKALEAMPDTTQAIFKMSRYSGLKNREIAEALQISIKTVESNMGRALKVMHQHLQSYLKSIPLWLFIWTTINK